MVKAELIFSDTFDLADFVINNNVSCVEVNSRDQTTIGVFSEDEIVNACTAYQAILKSLQEVV